MGPRLLSKKQYEFVSQVEDEEYSPNGSPVSHVVGLTHFGPCSSATQYSPDVHATPALVSLF